VLLARGAPSAAGDILRHAIGGWHAVEMPFEEARTRVLLAEAHRALGDLDAADLELDAARATFERLGARSELPDRDAPPLATPLTGRESEVVRLVADGRTNREIAAELCISEHTVARHLQNIFAKLGVSSRAAATAYAVKHGLL
jgi:DNA-binding NarL/FixJ family response regulator